mmetsp:Transcript_86380/g.140247  ORF Transcript_86380/g.140247 Transcript_86380/m.140247 type:complete len:239 (+) Transcript_86380:619-1335(+)
MRIDSFFFNFKFSVALLRGFAAHKGLLGGGHVEFVENDVSILEDVGLAFLSVPSLGLDLELSPVLLEISKGHDFSTDETLLEIGVDHSRALRRSEALTHHPAPHLVRSCSEKVLQVHHLKRRHHDLRQRRYHSVLLQIFGAHNISVRLHLDRVAFSAIASTHVLQLCLELARERQDRSATMRLDPVVDGLEPFVLFPLVVVLTEVHEIDDGLRGKQLILVDVLDVLRTPRIRVTTPHP